MSQGGPADASPEREEDPDPSQFTQRTHPDIIKVMITTDNHVGYMENDPVRGQDSIKSFREALQIAKEEKVDMVLLGGDLFHENKPSRNTITQVMAALREFTYGDDPLPLDYISDPHDNALNNYKFGAVNYVDGNYNVSIPVFSIHGNHDDPQGLGPDGALSALDVLATAGLINYFGKTNLAVGSGGPGIQAGATAGSAQLSKEIKIKPALLEKGATRLAMFGLGNIHDERLAMELRMRRVRLYQPIEEPDSYFNMLVLHQNRVCHNPKAVVPEGIFDDSLHLIVWGHEHEQRADPEPVPDKAYRICQPGSTVVTALSKGEDKAKSVVILKIHKRDYEITTRDLLTVRPFLIEDMDLEEELDERDILLHSENSKAEINKVLEARIWAMIDRAAEEWKAKHSDMEADEIPPMPLPLIRLRVNYEKHEVGNLARFGQKFAGKVANPKELLGFNKKRSVIRKQRAANGFVDVDFDMEDMVVSERLQKLDLGKIVGSVIREQELDCLPATALEEAVTQFVDKDTKSSISDFVNDTLKRQLKASLRGATDVDDIDRAVEAAHNAEKERADRRFGRQTEKEPALAGRKGKLPGEEEEGEHEQDGHDEDKDHDMLGFEDEEPLSPPPCRPVAAPAAKGKSKGKRPASPVERQPAKRAAPAKQGKLFRDESQLSESEVELIDLDNSYDDEDYGGHRPASKSKPTNKAMAPPPMPAASGRAAALALSSKPAPKKRAAPGSSQATTATKKSTSSRSSSTVPSSATPAQRAGLRRVSKLASDKVFRMASEDADELDDDAEDFSD